MIKIRLNIGCQEIVAEVKDMKAACKFNSTYGKLPKVCDACESPNIFLSYKSPQGNDYYMMECGDCGATANFGILKETQNLFWKREKMEKYVPNGGSGQGQAPPSSDDDIF